jgi:hemerythrin-like domain-containing protein
MGETVCDPLVPILLLIVIKKNCSILVIFVSEKEDFEMMPIGPLMIEHRLIERMIDVMKEELVLIEKEKKVDPEFIEKAVDFIHTYADRCHHGKEEDILFRDLGGKKLKDEYKRTMEELVEEHRWGRKITGRLVEANAKYVQGNPEALFAIINCIKSLIEFYPKHIEKEDKHFFIPCMDYFTSSEKDAMLKEEWEFDKSLIHEKYRNIVIAAEKILTAKKL